jgi:predicted O-methyltransferase YrrM
MNSDSSSLMLRPLQDGAEEERAIAATRSALEAALADRTHLGLSAASPPAQNEWALPVDELRFLARLVAHLRPQHILELGSGTSTEVLTRASAQFDAPCCVTSVDHDPDFRRSTIRGLDDQRKAGCRVALQFAPLVLRECGGKLLPVYRFRPYRFASRRPVDLVLIDGPPAALGGREGTLYQVLDFARCGTLVLLDDANRAEERAMLSRWQDNLGQAIEVKLLPEFSHGMAVILVREAITNSELWNHRLRLCKQELEALVPPEYAFIVVDQNLATDKLGRNGRAIPFLERDGQYFGPPADDATAIREVERLRHSRATFIAFVFPALWWLEHYSEFHHHLRSSYRCVLENDRLVVFDLRP